METVRGFKRKMDLFDAVCDMAPDDRAAFLHQACDGDADLRHAVESMVARDGSMADAIDEALETDADARRYAELIEADMIALARDVGTDG